MKETLKAYLKAKNELLDFELVLGIVDILYYNHRDAFTTLRSISGNAV